MKFYVGKKIAFYENIKTTPLFQLFSGDLKKIIAYKNF